MLEFFASLVEIFFWIAVGVIRLFAAILQCWCYLLIPSFRADVDDRLAAQARWERNFVLATGGMAVAGSLALVVAGIALAVARGPAEDAQPRPDHSSLRQKLHHLLHHPSPTRS